MRVVLLWACVWACGEALVWRERCGALRVRGGDLREDDDLEDLESCADEDDDAGCVQPASARVGDVAVLDEGPSEVFLTLHFDPIRLIYDASVKLRSCLRSCWRALKWGFNGASSGREAYRGKQSTALQTPFATELARLTRGAAAVMPVASSQRGAAAAAAKKSAGVVIFAARSRADGARLASALQRHNATLRVSLEDFVVWAAESPAAVKHASHLATRPSLPPPRRLQGLS